MEEGSPNNISPGNFENSTWRPCRRYGLTNSLPMADKSKNLYLSRGFDALTFQVKRFCDLERSNLVLRGIITHFVA